MPLKTNLQRQKRTEEREGKGTADTIPFAHLQCAGARRRKVDVRQQLDIAFRSNGKRHNEKVTKNRYVLTKIIDYILFCDAFELALRGHDERKDSVNTGVFRGLINFSAELDTSLKDHLTSATVFKRMSKEIQNDLLDCMLTVCQNHIRNEISKASFVSVIADETTDVSSISQLVVVFRYVLSNGQPVERFWGFTNPPGHDAQSIAECIQASLEKVVDKPEKLISQNYDGTNVMSGQHAGVQAFIQCAYKNAQYVHCYAHQLNLIAGRATGQNQQVRVFFFNLSDITNFFNSNSQWRFILDETVRKRIPHGSATRWNFKSRTINIVYEYREQLIECMGKIETTSKQAVAINQAGAIRRMLEDSKFVFWLTVFHNIMPHVDVLYNQLQKTRTDAAIIRKQENVFQQSFEKGR
ncbi:Zinc finger MYM-type protein 1 [Araneus ventricosus]|uniref:Zinc finger MYM-type protein 1 n=1 Tax=Araneus ventricosus TaxID=182803 RepID=A0A4Y2MUD0_ARAVE|nr:Zinc finger MYM-type protein 1 [Araneus ventricosus]